VRTRGVDARAGAICCRCQQLTVDGPLVTGACAHTHACDHCARVRVCIVSIRMARDVGALVADLQNVQVCAPDVIVIDVMQRDTRAQVHPTAFARTLGDDGVDVDATSDDGCVIGLE
jgi:hypothetical protein